MERDDKHIEFNDLMIRYLADEMTDSERVQFEKLIESDKHKLDQFMACRKIWDGVDQLAARSKYDMDAEWDLISGKLDLEAGEPDARRRSLRLTILRIAAVLVIGLMGAAGWYGGRELLMYERVAVESGTYSLELMDGSMITLNSGSKIRYTKKESLSYRKVKLSGEAFFEVARDTIRPFLIDAGPAQIEVLGTSFNVNAYPEKEDVEVTVSSGLVAMSARGNKENVILLNKGNSGVLSKKKSALNFVVEGNINAVAWKTGMLEFDEASLLEVIKTLSHTYQADIQLRDKELSDLTITVSFNNQELDAVLKVIANTLDLRIEQQDGQILIESAE